MAYPNILFLRKEQLYPAVRSVIYKQVRGTAPDTEVKNRVVEDMVCEAIICTDITSRDVL